MKQVLKFTCKQCGNQYPMEQFTKCIVCKIPLQQPSNGNQLRQHFSGEGHQGVQLGGDNHGTIIFSPRAEEPKRAIIYRESIKPIRIANTPIKYWWLLISGGVGFIGSVASIVGFWANLNLNVPSNHAPSSDVNIFITMISIMVFITGLILRRSKYITIPFSRTIESDHNGSLYLTKISGKCAHCDKPVKVKTVGPQNNKRTFVLCTGNSEHRWKFVPAALTDVGDDYCNAATGVA